MQSFYNLKENKETFVEILNYLKLKFNWKPTKITIDYSKAEKNAIYHAFPKIIIDNYFFHYIVNILKYFRELKSKNKNIKIFAIRLFGKC